MNSRRLFAALWVAVIVFVCVVVIRPSLSPVHPLAAEPTGSPTSPTTSHAAPAASTTASDRPVSPTRPVADVSHLLHPARKYFGVAMDNGDGDLRSVDQFARHVGKRPNLVTTYQAFGNPFPASDVRAAYADGALPLIRWEPFQARLSDIAAGRYDHYLGQYARAVRATNTPMAITFAHEMNGFWYPWDAHHASSADYIAAWRRIHDIFRDAGATNVIWSWAPNEISGGPGVRLVDWYPGDAYVDWIGIDGYFSADGPDDYGALFGPTLREIDRFTDRPYIIVETGAEAGWAKRRHALESLFHGVAADDRMIGFVYFDQPGSRQWQLTGDRAALRLYAAEARKLPFGFRVR